MKRPGINRMLVEALLLWILVVMVKATTSEDSLPIFLEEPESAVISHHASVTLPCKVLPSSAVVRWKFNGDTVKEGGSKGFSIVGTNLHIANFKHKRKQDSNEGIYQCIAETSVGRVASRPARLSKTVLKRFQSREDLRLNGTIGYSIVLPCQPPISSPEANILFELNGTIISTSSDHYRILSSGNLLIRNLTLNDQGTYRCIAVNPVSNQNRTSSHIISLSVRNYTQGSTTGNVNVYRPTEVEAHEGEDVTIECVAIGLPQPVVSWDKYGGSFPKERTDTIQGNLIIRNVTQEDTGTYLCKVNSGNEEQTVKDVYLKLIEPPTVTAETTSVTLTPSNSVKLRCQVRGSPKPEVIWYHNAVPISNILNVDENQGTTYSLNNVVHDDAGLYQCMSSNDIGVDYAVIRVDITGDRMASTTSNKNNNNPRQRPNVKRKNGKRRRKNRRNRKQRKNKKTKGPQPVNDGPDNTNVKLVPPSAPDVYQLSDTSVKLNWTVPANDGLNIIFFRVQYRVIKPKKSPWQTDDNEIQGDRRQYEVKNLVAEGTFKFRIAAVYSNNDNKAGPNSDKFTLHLPTYQQPQVPKNPPTIVEVKPITYMDNYALNIKWNYIPVKSSPIEGFFLYYKPFNSKGDYKKEMLMQPSIRTYLVVELKAATEYSLKMQCFNSEGMSDFSNTVVMKTQGEGKEPKFPFIPPSTSKPPAEQSNEGSPTKPDNQANSELLYMILGIVFGVLMLLLIVFIFMCWWKQRQQRRMMDAMNDAVLRNKFQDPSQRIYADSLRKKYVNGGYSAVPTAPPVQNGQVQNTYTKMNVNVNPLSEMDMHSMSNGHTGNQLHQSTTFVPNGTLPSQYSDNNNKQNLDNSLEGSQCLNTPDSMGSGEAPAIPPSPNSYSVPIGYDQFTTSDSQEQYSNKSCDQLAESHDPNNLDFVKQCSNDSSVASENSVHSGKHKRRRKRKAASSENSTRDQATNTDLSSNEGTMEFSHVNRDTNSPEAFEQCYTRTSSSEDCDQVV
ncbi:interference hedgehog-like isoform X2 [Mytilus edulis]|uniref:interference hedgehog-like isoform X2 n=1 Tax=Mytilus edulis TaxID=6550 RepID=UPI0039EE6E39